MTTRAAIVFIYIGYVDGITIPDFLLRHASSYCCNRARSIKMI
jgi:hypothetical protein